MTPKVRTLVYVALVSAHAAVLALVAAGVWPQWAMYLTLLASAIESLMDSIKPVAVATTALFLLGVAAVNVSMACLPGAVAPKEVCVQWAHVTDAGTFELDDAAPPVKP